MGKIEVTEKKEGELGNVMGWLAGNRNPTEGKGEEGIE